jgi:hypothetical protein
MPYNPNEIICEILGQPAETMTNPVNEDYLCPFRNSTCAKRSHSFNGPFPVCSVFRQRKGEERMPIAVCPRRLYAADIYNDVIQYVWPGENPSNPISVHEIKMGDVGNVDMVIADLSDDKKFVKDFVSIELQAVDITGTYEPAYTSIVLNQPLNKRPTYNFNYKNVQKRFITQLIDKGFYHHHWGTKIIAVVQDVIYDILKERINFSEVNIEKSNVVFMQYSMVLVDTPDGKRYELELKGVTGTTHNELMMSSFYQMTPPKEEFCNRILRVYNTGN